MKITHKTLIISITILLFTTTLVFADTSSAKIHINPAKAVYASPFTLSVSELESGETITISSTSIDKKKIQWNSSASFKADSNGIVDLAKMAPFEGAYNKADTYGLLWSMTPVNSTRKEINFNYDLENGLTIVFKVTDSKGNETTARLLRYYEDPETPLFRIKLEKNGLIGTLYSPDDKQKYPAVILLGGSNGGSVHWLAKAIAVHGFAVLDLPYFKYAELPESLVNIKLEYFHKAVKWIQEQKTVKKGKIGMVGGSRGAELALQLASMFDEFKAVVAWVPAAHLWAGEEYEKVVPAWTWEGRALPYIGEIFSKEEMQKLYSGQMTSYVDFFLNTLKNVNPELRKEATIPIEKIKAPLLLISGKDDQTWPSSLFSDMVIRRLKKYNYKYEYKHLAFENAGHLVFLPDFITATFRHFNGGSRDKELHGSIQSWHETISFLHKHLDK